MGCLCRFNTHFIILYFPKLLRLYYVYQIVIKIDFNSGCTNSLAMVKHELRNILEYSNFYYTQCIHKQQRSFQINKCCRGTTHNLSYSNHIINVYLLS